VHTAAAGASALRRQAAYFALAAIIGLIFGACRTQPEQAPVARDALYEGSVLDWVPTTATAAVWVDIAALRQAPELAALIPAEGSQLDGVSRAVVAADELAFFWPEIDLDERVAVVRGDIDQPALLDALRTQDNFTGAPFEIIAAHGRQAWKSRAGDWTVSIVWPNLVLAGDLAAVLNALSTPPLPNAANPAEAAVAYATFRVDPMHRRLLSRSARLGELAPMLEPIETIALTAFAEADPRFELRLQLAANTDPIALIALVEVLIQEVLAPPDDGRARAAPGIATRVEGDETLPVIVTEVVLPRGQLVAIARSLSESLPEAAPSAEVPAEASGAP
jgi:hypothetical protein